MNNTFPRTNEDIVALEGRLYNRIVSELERALRFTVASPLQSFDTGAGRVITLASSGDETIVVRLTSGTGPYQWKEVRPKSDGTFPDIVGGRTSDPFGSAISPGGGGYTTGATNGTVVTIRRGFDPSTGAPLWTIMGTSQTIDVFNGTTLFQSNVAKFAIGTARNTNGVFAWSSTTLGGSTNGASFELKSGVGTARMVLQIDASGNLAVDYVRTI